MKVELSDYNGADLVIRKSCAREWVEIDAAVSALPLHLKSSDQADIRGSPIFDPIGTNAFLRQHLQSKGWSTNIPIPEQYSFLGTDIDVGKNGVIVEVQFSNYPFLLNNTLRSELFYKAAVEVASQKTRLAIIVTKGHMFPASNSTLYYEQARNQLNALCEHKVLNVPVRLVGLTIDVGSNVPVVWTIYKKARYSRTIKSQAKILCEIIPGTSPQTRCKIVLPNRKKT